MKLIDALEQVSLSFRSNKFKTLMSSLGIIIGVIADSEMERSSSLKLTDIPAPLRGDTVFTPTVFSMACTSLSSNSAGFM